MGNLIVSDLQAASWGSSWEPDARDRRDWLECEEWPPPDEPVGVSGAAPDDGPLFEAFGGKRLVLLSR